VTIGHIAHCSQCEGKQCIIAAAIQRRHDDWKIKSHMAQSCGGWPETCEFQSGCHDLEEGK